jgi:hypothetical protein
MKLIMENWNKFQNGETLHKEQSLDEQAQMLTENPALIAKLAPMILDFLTKNPQLMKALTDALLPLLTSAMGGGEAAAEGGGAPGAPAAGLPQE